MRAELIGASVLGIPSELPRFLAAGIGKHSPQECLPMFTGSGLLDGKIEKWKKQACHT